MKEHRHHYALGLAALLIGGVGCASQVTEIADLETGAAERRARGKAIVDRAIDAHGGLAAWRGAGDITFTMVDTWPGLIGALAAPPYPTEPATMRYAYNFHLGKGRIEFVGTDEVWGHDSVEGWRSVAGKRVYDDIEDVTFVVPTLAYFVGLPFKFADPGVNLHYVGADEWNDRPVETVLVTFHEGIGAVQDRYLAMFDPESGRFVATTFTVKEQGDLPQGAADYLDWQEVGGMVLPGRIEIASVRPPLGHLHTMEVLDVEPEAEFDRDLYEKPL